MVTLIGCLIGCCKVLSMQSLSPVHSILSQVEDVSNLKLHLIYFGATDKDSKSKDRNFFDS